MESLEDFDYIIKRYVPTRVCFGSTLEREPLPDEPRLMNSFMRRKTTVNTGDAPIQYGDGRSKCHCRELSKQGYGPMASKVPRFAKCDQSRLERKKKRYKIASVVKLVPQMAKPFGSSGKFYEIESITPGPGRYNMGALKRKIIVSESFGGRRRLIPAVATVCQPTFMDMCYVCRQKPRGIYWKNFRLGKSLCRYCKVIVQSKHMAEKSKDMGKHFELLEFQRARYCDYIHNHHNTKAKIQVISRQALTNLLRIENYLSMFNM